MKYKYGNPDKYGDFPYLYAGQYKDEELNDILLERLPESYDMQLVDPLEIEILAHVVNQGIDAHLEAATRSKEPHAVPIEVSGQCFGHKYGIGFDKPGMICLIRRLMEFDAEKYEYESEVDLDPESADYNCEYDPWFVAYNLVSSILETLDIEFSGC